MRNDGDKTPIQMLKWSATEEMKVKINWLMWAIGTYDCVYKVGGKLNKPYVFNIIHRSDAKEALRMLEGKDLDPPEA